MGLVTVPKSTLMLTKNGQFWAVPHPSTIRSLVRFTMASFWGSFSWRRTGPGLDLEVRFWWFLADLLWRIFEYFCVHLFLILIFCDEFLCIWNTSIFCPGFVYFWFFVNFRWILYIAFLSRVLRKYGDPVNLAISFWNFDFLWGFFVYFEYIYFLSRVSLFYDILQIKCEFGTSIFCPVFDVNMRIQIWGSNENEEALNILDAFGFATTLCRWNFPYHT